MEITLSVRREGHGPPLILLHGNNESSRYFAGQIPAFRQHFTVYAPDTRGHGESPRGTAPFTLKQFAEDLKDFMDGEKIDKADLLGFSDGGNIALLFALRYPERVHRLILDGANLFPSGVSFGCQLTTVLEYGAASAGCLFSQRFRKKKEMLGLMVKEPHISFEELSVLQMPVLVLAGNRDLIKKSHTRKIAEALPDAKLVILPGSHWVAGENPEAFNRAVLHFLLKETK